MSDQSNNQQAVVDQTNTQAQPASEVQNARDDGGDLERLLNEYESSRQSTPAAPPPPQPAAPQPQPDVNYLQARVEALQGTVNEVAAMKVKTDIAAAVKDIRGDLDPAVADDEDVESWLQFQAMKDKRISDIFSERERNPKQWEKTKRELGKQFAQKYSRRPDRNATEDRAAVAAAVRGTSTRAPESPAPNYASLSDQAFQAEKDKLFGR